VKNARAFNETREKARLQECHTLARSLHSGAAQTVFLLGLEADVGLELHEVQEIRQHMITLRRLAVRAGEELRGLIASMRSRQEIQQNPLVALLQKKLNNFQAQSDFPVALYAGILPASLPPSVIEAVYRMIAEYLDSLAHQTGVAGVIVRLNAELGKLTVEIRDFDNPKTVRGRFDGDDLSMLAHTVKEIHGASFSSGRTEDGSRYFSANFGLFS